MATVHEGPAPSTYPVRESKQAYPHTNQYYVERRVPQ